MDEPIYFPDDGDVPKSTMDVLNNKVIEAAKSGQNLTTLDIRSIFDDSIFDAYNNETVRAARRGQFGAPGASGAPATTNPNSTRDTSGY